MKKIIIVLMVVMMSTTLVTSSMAKEKGGCLPFLGSCCLGPRIGLEMNEGKRVRTLEWVRLVPIVGLFAHLWISVEAFQGKTMSEIAKEENL